jgi:hypothetical protein
MPLVLEIDPDAMLDKQPQCPMRQRGTKALLP